MSSSPQPNDSTNNADPPPPLLHNPTLFQQDTVESNLDHGHRSITSASAPPPPLAPVPHARAPELSSVSSVAPARQLAPPRRTDHTYYDHAAEELNPLEYPITKKSSTNFPAKLHRMISDPMNFQAIQWQPHGRAWRVLDRDLLVEMIIPKYFGQTKYESFTRQLSGWGFKRLHQSGPDYRCYYHECFLRGLPHLTRKMERAVPNQGKLLPNVEAEPNFYEMDRLHPLPHHQPQPSHPDFGVGGTAVMGAYPYQNNQQWPPYNAPYDQGHYHGHAPPPPPNYPPPYQQYPYPYPHHNPRQPSHQQMSPPQGQNQMPPPPPPYHGAGHSSGDPNAFPRPEYGQHAAGYPNNGGQYGGDHQYQYPDNHNNDDSGGYDNSGSAYHQEPDHQPHPHY